MKFNLSKRLVTALILSLIIMTVAFAQTQNQSFAPYKLHSLWGQEENTLYKYRDHGVTCYYIIGKSSNSSWVQGNGSTASSVASAPITISCVQEK